MGRNARSNQDNATLCLCHVALIVIDNKAEGIAEP
jgi:hypothetical protein